MAETAPTAVQLPSSWRHDIAEPVTSFTCTYERMTADARGRWHLTLLVQSEQFDKVHPLVGQAALEVQIGVFRMPMVDPDSFKWEDLDAEDE
jgi:hypothetical protein